MNDPVKQARDAVVAPLSALVAALLVSAQLLRADDDQVRDTASATRALEQEANVVSLDANLEHNVFEMAGFNWAFRGPGGDPPATREPGRPGSAALARVRALGETRLERLGRTCDLSPEQQRRLRLAMELECRRIAADIEEVRRTYAGVSVNMRDPQGQQTFHRFQSDVQRCRRRLMKAFEEGSVFAEAQETVLDESQRAALVAETADRRSFRWRTLVAAALVRIDDMATLEQSQHAAVERLLLELEPPLRLEPSRGQRNEQAEQMLVWMQLAEADPQALRDAVGEDRAQVLKSLGIKGRQMRSWIEGQGLIEPGGGRR